MERKEIIEKLDSIIESSVNHHNYIMSENLVPKDVDKWDSLANAMIITSIETTFGIKFKFVDITGWDNVGELVDIISSKL